ncbi:TIGR04255 family protein [Burkholderia multivorans]|uniref:TIGR04255 family protein n=1 Tax=Burkholderia multivorans TaxID=87883 RepID=A0AAP2HLY0_9BURK|nr:TIGR04255 family protein [Burkholderia multivorans]MBU9185290.1 TIGR04255 family protein [Burkholderia multivorans]MBU9358798.1 TIGR04255 family protein [Burkholderia multivorans]MCA8504778.1 TIGR04255 family protein [Burkholderia multivorans]MDN8083629.1 TIGR04255 family protein [Burkholderia multivorans]PRE29279.1 TIGR04255 family protein [Burkholderia multivorans]
MATKPLPTKLGKEPLIDVVCGVNFESDAPADSLLPGLLLPKLDGKQPRFEPLPAAQLPQVLRDNDPNLQNAPLMRVVVDERFTVLIGSKWLGVGCQMPYAGWAAFSEMIQTVFGVLGDAPFVKAIVRHSLKYVDFIAEPQGGASLSRFQINIEIAERKISDQPTQLRTEIAEPPFLHATTIYSPATANKVDGTKVQGALVDVDTHRIERFSVEAFLRELPQLLDAIHSANKEFFFALLSDAGLQELEPRYD